MRRAAPEWSSTDPGWARLSASRSRVKHVDLDLCHTLPGYRAVEYAEWMLLAAACRVERVRAGPPASPLRAIFRPDANRPHQRLARGTHLQAGPAAARARGRARQPGG